MINFDINTLVLPTPSNRVGLEDAVRGLRDTLLKEKIDTFNPIRYATLTTEQQQELATYRQALLDVPAQAGYPANVVWPVPPSFV
jgi:hypothetical protein